VVGETVRIVDHAAGDGVVRDVEFEGCTIVGPAVLLPRADVTIGDCRFDAELPGLFWTVSPGATASGGIGLENCVFRGCRFERVGLGGTPEEVRQLMKGFDVG
jgi:hypothetical protein